MVQAVLTFHYYFANNFLEKYEQKPPAKLSRLSSASSSKLKIVFCSSNVGSRLEEYEISFTFESPATKEIK